MKAFHLGPVAVVVLGTAGAAVAEPPQDRPFVVSATYWGGSQAEDFAAVAVDAAGNVYVAGTTASADFPRTVATLPALGSSDVFVTKFDPAGVLVFTTVFGGSSSERVTGMAVDAGGHVIVVGDTFSSDLPVANAIQGAFHPGFCGEFGATCPDGFVVKLDSAGQSLVFSTYLGSTVADNVLDVAVDAAGNVYVTGATESPTFEGATPTRPYAGGRDAFVARIPPAGGTFAYFTYLGGGFTEAANGIAADLDGNAYVTGVTGSQDFPTLFPIQNGPENFSDSAFVTKLDPAGVIAYSTYLGGHGSDAGVDIAVDRVGGAHVVGITSSTNFPVINARQGFLRGVNDVFVTKLNSAGSGFIYSTYLGGNNREQVGLDFSPGLDVTVDASGRTYVSGATQSSDFPALYAIRPFGGGVCVLLPFQIGPCPDAFVAQFEENGVLLFSTPVGGTGDDRGRGVAVGPEGMIHLVGTTGSLDFPVVSALQPALSGPMDAFVVKISAAPSACQLPAPQQISPSGGVFEQPTFSWRPVEGAGAYAVVLLDYGQAVLSGVPPAQLLGITAATSLDTPVPLPSGDYVWLVVPWNASCGWGRASHGMTFTLPGTCPAPLTTQTSPVGGAVVSNPVRLDWTVEGTSVAAFFGVLVLRSDGQLVGRYATAGRTFTIPTTLPAGDYRWWLVPWNSTCGGTLSGPGFFRSTGGVGQ